jgi:hypothetical protein
VSFGRAGVLEMKIICPEDSNAIAAPSRVVECSSLEEGIVDDAWRPIVAKKRTVEFVSIFIHRSAKIRPSSLHVVAAEIVQKIAKGIGNGPA